MSGNGEPTCEPSWPTWLPRHVRFVRDGQGRVCALRSFDGGAPVELELGAVIVRAQPDTPRPGTIEWSVHADTDRHCDEAKAAFALVQYSLASLEALQERLVKETAQRRPVAPGRRRALCEMERSALRIASGAFLLVDPLSHPELARLYHPKILGLLERMPDLRGRLNLPAPGG